MEKEIFEQYRELWKAEWHNHWRLLDIDFEAYMLMRGLPKAEFDKLNKEGKPIILHIHAKWCSTCAAQDPILNSLMKTPEFKNFTFYNVDFDTSKDLLKTLKVSRQSAIIVFKQGKEQGRSLGDTKESSIKELIKKAI